jgi:hypothetical protein
MRKVLVLLAAIGAMVFAAGCGDHCDSCHSDNYRRTQNSSSVAMADK